jgi:Protein of unknown function (DUF1049).
MYIIKLIFSLVVALILTVFAVKNSQIVPIDLWPLPLQFNLTLSLVILGAFFTGLLCGGFLVWCKHVLKKLFRLKSDEEDQSPVIKPS